MKVFAIALLTVLLTASCTQEKDPFLIQNGSVGLLTKDIRVSQLDSVFALDSVVRISSNNDSFIAGGDIEIYDKAGSLLLVLTPAVIGTDTSKIKTIQIKDARFTTAKGLAANSTFKQIKDNYTIGSIDATISSVLVSMNETDAYVIIDKKQLPESLRYTSDPIEVTQIPETATFKYMMIDWDHSVNNTLDNE